MQIRFPCGSKGSPGFCPNVCQYGKFCKIKEKKEEPRGPSADELICEQDKEPEEKDFKIETY